MTSTRAVGRAASSRTGSILAKLLLASLLALNLSDETGALKIPSRFPSAPDVEVPTIPPSAQNIIAKLVPTERDLLQKMEKDLSILRQERFELSVPLTEDEKEIFDKVWDPKEKRLKAVPDFKDDKELNAYFKELAELADTIEYYAEPYYPENKATTVEYFKTLEQSLNEAKRKGLAPSKYLTSHWQEEFLANLFNGNKLEIPREAFHPSKGRVYTDLARKIIFKIKNELEDLEPIRPRNSTNLKRPLPLRYIGAAHGILNVLAYNRRHNIPSSDQALDKFRLSAARVIDFDKLKLVNPEPEFDEEEYVEVAYALDHVLCDSFFDFHRRADERYSRVIKAATLVGRLLTEALADVKPKNKARYLEPSEMPTVNFWLDQWLQPNFKDRPYINEANLPANALQLEKIAEKLNRRKYYERRGAMNDKS